MNRREYPVRLTVNGRRIVKVIIDSHYELKHSDSITDALILDLVNLLSGKSFEPDAETDGFQYFVADNLVHEENRYRLIWMLERDEFYVGVVNAYRRRNE